VPEDGYRFKPTTNVYERSARRELENSCAPTLGYATYDQFTEFAGKFELPKDRATRTWRSAITGLAYDPNGWAVIDYHGKELHMPGYPVSIERQTYFNRILNMDTFSEIVIDGQFSKLHHVGRSVSEFAEMFIEDRQMTLHLLGAIILDNRGNL
jgi:hypothetical protein